MGALAPAAAVSAPYPEKPVRLIVALAPGGPADTARVFAPAFTEALGQNVLVENRPGGSAVVGTEAAVRAAPDGYTLLFASSSTLAINPAVLKNLRFDALKELRLIGLICYTHVLVVRAALPAQTLADLVRLSKAQPDTLRYGSSGIGGAIHLAGELVKRETGADLRHIPYRGGGPATAGLLAGDIDVFISDLSTTTSISAPAGSGRWRWPGRRARRSSPSWPAWPSVAWADLDEVNATWSPGERYEPTGTFDRDRWRTRSAGPRTGTRTSPPSTSEAIPSAARRPLSPFDGPERNQGVHMTRWLRLLGILFAFGVIADRLQQ